MNLTTIRQALADQIEERLTHCDPKPSVWSYAPLTPMRGVSILITPAAQNGEYVTTHGTMGPSALCDIGLRVEVRVDGQVIDSARILDAYLSIGTDESIVDAIEANATLNNVVQNVYVSGATIPARFTIDGNSEWLSASFDLIVRARRS